MDLKELLKKAEVNHELMEKLKAVKTKDDFIRILEEEDLELTPEQVASLAGGSIGDGPCDPHLPFLPWECPPDFCHKLIL